MVYKGIHIDEQIITFDNLDTQLSVPLLTINNISIRYSDNDHYIVDFNYYIFKTNDMNFVPINFYYTNLTTSIIVVGKDNIINKCYLYISDYLTNNSVSHSLINK